MPCPPQVPISVIPPVSAGVGPLVWENGNQIARLNPPLNPAFVIYDGSVTRFGDGSAQFPIRLPNLQLGNGAPQYYVGSNLSGTLAFYSNPSTSGAFLNANQTFTGSNTFTQPLVASGGVLGNLTGNATTANTATTANSATTAGTATAASNLVAGAAGGIPYQVTSGSTTFLPIGSRYQILTSGVTAPYWQTGIYGVEDGSNASSGFVGEWISNSTPSSISLSITNGFASNITSIILTAGDWDVSGLGQFHLSGVTGTYFTVTISTISTGLTIPSGSLDATNCLVTNFSGVSTTSQTGNVFGNDISLPTKTMRISLSTNTIIYLNVQAGFSAGTVKAYGNIEARRMR